MVMKVGGIRRLFMLGHRRIGAILGKEIIGHESYYNGGIKVALDGRFMTLY